MDTLREDLHKFWQRCGHLKPPLELVTLAAKGPAKFYPVDDGEGGGELFTDNASAHEYLHLEEGRRMIRCTSTIELGYDAIHAPGKRMPPPPQPPAAAAMTRAYGAGAGPSGAGPSAQEAPSERRETPTHGNLARQVRSPTPDTSSECSDRSTIEAASSPASTSSQTWLSGDDVAKLQHVSSLTVFMVRCADTRRDGARRDGPVLFQLGRCYDRRGLSCHNDISASVMRQYDKTIACAQNDWHLPLGGQAEGKSKNLKEAIIGLAYEGVVRFDTRVHRCVALLKHNVESGTAHVLCCREIPSAKPMYCIFEDSSRPSEDDTLLFTDDYLQNERRKLTGLTYVTKLRSPPWVAKVLLLLEKRLRAPTSAAVVEEEREAHMTHRPEHTDDGVEDMRHDAVNRFIQALSPGSPHSHHESDDTSAATCASPEHSVILLGRVSLPRVSGRLYKPRFAARWTQLRYNLMLHRIAQATYVALVFMFMIFAAAGGSSHLTHGGWRMVACLLASNSPVAAHCTVAYVDYIVIYTDTTAEQHLKDVEGVLQTLANAGIRLHSGVGEFCEKRFCDSLCFALAGDPPIGVEATPEMQWSWKCSQVTSVPPLWLISFERVLFKGNSGSWFVDFSAKTFCQLRPTQGSGSR
ncbi:hypothetical protein CYMTET_4845 [Cymbomonas tetramitiformis]|uniref:Uncharacterized protein n=1 Tax=Cymbomonas tetramitiformis TaxID=36881 RepID=A0AAE0H0K5_9CHLO|nr:hypothetical protein CYMTET_4845 [Cymbomonas tetramitiformis]